MKMFKFIKSATQKTKDKAISSLSLCLLCFVALACSSHPEPIHYDLTTNAQSELPLLRSQLRNLEEEKQVSIFSPNEYAGAKKYLDRTQAAIQSNSDQETIVRNLGIAKAYIEKSAAVSDRMSSSLLDVREAREKALKAGSLSYAKSELLDIDDDLIDETEEGIDFVSKMSLPDKRSFQQRYSDLELMAIKANKLGPARSYLKAAQKLGAERLIPHTFKKAQEKIASAEALIDGDRYNFLIDMTCNNATEDAKKLVEITKTAKKSQGQSTEEIALEIDKGSQVETLEGELADKDAASKKMREVQRAFKKNEAEVYRQGDKVLIRIKDLKFPSGSSNLPDTSLDLLGRVRQVVESLSPSSLVVEGHTDATGKKSTNMKLSEERADAVKNYLVSTNAVSDSLVTTKGVGPDKPIKTNNTPEGRATNRRVDIIIEPAGIY